MRRLCECGLHYRHDRPYPKLIEVHMSTESICTSASDPIAKETNHATYVMGRRCGVIQLRVPEWMADWIWNSREAFRRMREAIS